jgi:transposase-like protein
MPRIVPAILSLQQHLDALEREPAVYRPAACPHCGLGRLWGHGCYERKADRRPSPAGALNPVAIPRFFCQGCRQTCSRLPECIAPRRWYDWVLQQAVLLLVLGGGSLHQAALRFGLDRRTVRRWWVWLGERSDEFGLFLRARFSDLGRAVDFRRLWQGCLNLMALSRAMAWLDQDGVVVP